MFDWEEGDRFSFEDSDRFEEDSLCSWISEPESLCNNWRGWKKQNGGERPPPVLLTTTVVHDRTREVAENVVLPLVELAAREVACHIPFEVVEHVYPPVPEQLQLRIAYWSFPENEEDIRLYSCLANGSADEFQKGEHLYRARAVKDPLQIGFHLSATVILPQPIAQTKGSYNVAITFDRRRITSCNCTCTSAASWCAHVVAVCLHRIHLPHQVCLRAPVSESLSRLHRDQLQKFAQYLISELPQQILPTAQRLLDELLSCQQTAINTVCGAPDPTAGASANEQTTWCLDEATLHENIRKILIKFCVPSPIVFSDVNYLSSTAPPAAAEWSSLLRPLRGREPEGMWNLLSIVREMLRRSDRNAVPLLKILTEECLSCEQILVWWFYTKVSLHNGNTGHGGRNNVNSNSHPSKHACSSLCDEIVVLWRLGALNPALSPQERSMLCTQMKEWHLRTIEKVCKTRGGGVGGSGNSVRKSDIEVFPGFKPAIEACFIDWSDYPIPGIAYNESSASKYYFPYTTLRTQESHYREINASPVVLNCEHPSTSKRCRSVDFSHDRRAAFSSTMREVRIVTTGVVQSSKPNDSNRSSVSSEGFCENENDIAETTNNSRDSDSVEESEAAIVEAGRLLKSHQPIHLAAQASGSKDPSKFFTLSFPDCNKLSLPLTSTPTKCRKNSEGNHFKDEKEKLSPDEMEVDSDWSSAPESSQKKPNKMLPERREVPLKFERSESQQSSDECQVYHNNSKTKNGNLERPKEKKQEDNLFAGLKKMDDPLEILFARAEALHAHGHTREACKLGVQLAEELLANPPNLMVELPPPPNKGKRKKKVNPASHHISCLASATLAKAAFLCTVLAENAEHYHLAFVVGMFGLELARPPASTKALEVKLANQESDLVTLLKRIPLGPAELRVIRERAEQLRNGTLRSRGEALLPLNLASFIFDAMCSVGNSPRNSNVPSSRLPSDEIAGFEAAVAALGLKANVSEAEHPLLCEGTRRQRGELTITLLVHYKDDKDKLAKIMDKLLDKEVHQMFKAHSLSSYYSSKQPNGVAAPAAMNKIVPSTSKKEEMVEVADVSLTNESAESSISVSISQAEDTTSVELEQELANISLNVSNNSCGGARAKEPTRYSARCVDDQRDDTSSPTWEEDYKAWEAKFRCANLRTHKKHSAGMASIDSSAPETTSSDNSPTLIRRSVWGKPAGPGSDSGSSGKSSDSFGSSSSGDKNTRTKPRENESPSLSYANKFGQAFSAENVPRNVTSTTKVTRFKGKRVDPTIPNQPSEASAHFMFELAKTVLSKAGGNSSTSLFTQPSTSQNHRGPHRALHMCAFQIGLYALGLHNCVSPNWLSRTYSSHVSWITSQATEIGSAAISFLIDTWEGHLTPPEVASLADHASRGRDPNMVRAAAELALSCLPHAHALNPNEIQRAILQCKEQSNTMLERACLAVESAAKGGGVYPEVLFDVARRWHELYSEGQAPDPVPHAPEAPELDQNLLQDQSIFSQEGLPILPQVHCSLPVSYAIHPQPTSILSHVPYPSTYNYVTSFPPHQCSPHLSLHPIHHTAYVAPPFPYANRAPFGMPTYYAHATIPATTPHLRPNPPPTPVYSSPILSVPNNQQPRASVIAPAQQLPLVASTIGGQPPQQPQVSAINQTQLNYLLSAYRVGMLAMETLARRVHDDRPNAKYARNPPYGEDVKWLLGIAKKLGSSYVQQFCLCTVNSVLSPFLLQDITLEAAQYLARNNPNHVLQHLRSPILTPLVQKCQQMFIQCTHLKMYHLTPSEYDEFVSIIRTARTAFQMTPGGMVQFNEFLQALRRSKTCKKDLWQRIANALQTTTI